MRYGSVDVLACVLVKYSHYGDFTVQHRQQRFLSCHSPTVEPVNDGIVRPHNDGECPSVGEDGLGQQLQIFLADFVGVIVVRFEQFPVHPFQSG
jgi:hypothetical protein